MKSVLLIGLGRFGRHIAMKLNELNHEVLAVDKDEQNVNAVLPYVTDAQIGDSTDEQYIAALGVKNFDLCIVAIGDDFQSSLETTSLLKEMGAAKVIARAARDVQAKFLLRNGADDVVYPEKQMAIWTAIRYSSEQISDYVDLGDNHSIFEIKVPDKWIGKSVGELQVRQNYNVSVLAIKQNGKFSQTTVSPDTVFAPGSSMLIFGITAEIERNFKL